MGKNPKEDPKDRGRPQPSSWLRRRLGYRRDRTSWPAPKPSLPSSRPRVSVTLLAGRCAGVPPSAWTSHWSLSSPSSPAQASPPQVARAGPQQVGAGPRAPVSRGQSPKEEQDVARPVTAEVVLWFPRCPAVDGYMLFQEQPGHFVFNGQKLFI